MPPSRLIDYCGRSDLSQKKIYQRNRTNLQVVAKIPPPSFDKYPPLTFVSLLMAAITTPLRHSGPSDMLKSTPSLFFPFFAKNLFRRLNNANTLSVLKILLCFVPRQSRSCKDCSNSINLQTTKHFDRR